ncbi:Uncharacterised protein [Yersinia enterocolitica]|nr:Uncharacterised protein [Yersinia enterocolitica]
MRSAACTAFIELKVIPANPRAQTSASFFNLGVFMAISDMGREVLAIFYKKEQVKPQYFCDVAAIHKSNAGAG